MAHDEEIAERIREALSCASFSDGELLGEIKMFGGLCFTLDKKMLIGIGKEKLMVRLSDADLDEALADGRAEPMDFTGRPLRNFAYILPDAYASQSELIDWIEKSTRFVRTAKVAKRKR